MFLGKRGLKLKGRLVLSMVLTILLSCVVTAFVLTQRNNSFVEEEFVQEIDKALSTFEMLLQEEREAMMIAFNFLSQNEALIEAISQGDREETAEIIHTYYQWLNQDFFMTHMQVIDPELRSFYRGHQPDSYGDSLDFRNLLVQVRDTQRTVQAFERGVYGYVLRTTGPLYDEEGDLLALFELGMNLDDRFIDEASEQVGVDLTVFHGNERITTTIRDETGARAIGTTIDTPMILEEVLQRGGRWAGRLEIVGDNDIYGAYTAILDAQGNVDGMLFAGYSAAEVDAYRRENILLVGLILLLIILFSILLASYLANRIINPIRVISKVLDRMANGDFTQEARVKSKDETGQIAQDLNSTIGSLRRTLKQVQSSSDNVTGASSEISSGNQDLSQRTEEQASSLEEISSTIEEITTSLETSSANALEADRISRTSLNKVEEGTDVVEELQSSMGEITESSKRIGEIISTVNDIAFQTNLLALNAAVEAARAGEQGRGFAVVASEVRNLAHRAEEASKEIETLINESIDRVSRGNTLMDDTGTVLQEIVANTQKTTDIIGEISASLKGQSSGALAIRENLEELNQATQQNASLVEEIASSSENMNAEAIELKDLVTSFQLRKSGEDLEEEREVSSKTIEEDLEDESNFEMF